MGSAVALAAGTKIVLLVLQVPYNGITAIVPQDAPRRLNFIVPIVKVTNKMQLYRLIYYS